MEQLIIFCSHLYPAQFFPNSVDPAFQKVTIELIVYLPVENGGGGSQLIISPSPCL